MTSDSSRRLGTRVTATALLSALLLTACGGDGDGSSDADAADVVTEATGDVAVQDDDDATASAELHPALAGFPLPAGYEVPFPADDYSADVDERETVVQLILVEMPVDEVARFMLAELPAAGYDILDQGSLVTVDDIEPGLGGLIRFDGPDPAVGQVTINPQGDTTSLNINYYRAGD
jgi:hypothetical protein